MELAAETKGNVLVVSSEFPPGPGGIGHHCFSLCKALHDSGYDITVLTSGDYAEPVELLHFDSNVTFRIIRYERYRKSWATYFARIITTLRIGKGDVYTSIILTGKFSLWQVFPIKLLLKPKVPVIGILHGSEVNLEKWYLRQLTHKAIQKLDYIVPVSEFTKSLLPIKILNNEERLRVIPNGIDEVWPVNTKIEEKILKGTPCLLTIGHVSPRKGQHRVVKALPYLRKIFPDIHYNIVGLPLQKHRLEILAQELGVSNHITFHDRVKRHEDLSMYYQQADVFMLLSENQPNGDVEGFGIVALEANQHGLPVVGAKYCGVEEAVCHEKSGFLVDGDIPEEIVEGVRYCVTHKNNLTGSSKLWAEKHSWNSIVKEYIKLFE